MEHTYYIIKSDIYFYKKRLFKDGINILSEKECMHNGLIMIELKLDRRYIECI